MLALNRARGFLHRRFVERIRIMPHITRQERGADRRAQNSIAISFSARRLARVKVGRRPRSPRARGSRAAECHSTRAASFPPGSRTRSQNSRPGQARARPHRCGPSLEAVHFRRSNVQWLRRARPGPSAAGLHLPAGKIGAIIRKNQSEITHVLFRILGCMGNIIVTYNTAVSPQKARRRVSYTISLTINLFAIKLFATKKLGTLSFPPSPIGRPEEKIARNSCLPPCV